MDARTRGQAGAAPRPEARGAAARAAGDGSSVPPAHAEAGARPRTAGGSPDRASAGAARSALPPPVRPERTRARGTTSERVLPRRQVLHQGELERVGRGEQVVVDAGAAQFALVAVDERL